MPITLLLTAIAVPAGLISAEGLRQLAGHPATRLYLFVLISLPMFHWAHRFHYVAVDLGCRKISAVLPPLCYGTALVVTLLALYYLV